MTLTNLVSTLSGMDEPDFASFTVAIRREGDGWISTAISTTIGSPAARGDGEHEDNPFEAACNAVAQAMSAAGFDS